MTLIATVSHDLRATIAHHMVSAIRDGYVETDEGPIPWDASDALIALRCLGLTADPDVLLDALSWQAAIEAYSEPDYHDGSEPHNRQEYNVAQLAEAQVQYAGCLRRLGEVAE